MPCTRNVKSLRIICTEYVQNSLTSWFNKLVNGKTAESVTELLAKEESDEINRSFIKFVELLPSTLLWKLVRIHFTPLNKRNRFLWCYLRMLVTKEHSFIFMERKEIVCGLLEIASKRFPKLKTLKIAAVTDINLFVSSNIHKFQKLQKLCLWHSDVGDSCLIYVGIFLRDLRDLDVRGCSKVTDAGIAGLCVSVGYSEKEKEMLGKCKSIRRLRVFKSSVSRKGIEIALRNLPALQKCDGVSIQLLAEMHLADFVSQKLLSMPKYSLTVLDIPPCGSNHYISGSLDLIAFLCPSLTMLNVGSIGSRDERDLLSLSVLEKLSELKIVFTKQPDILTFNDGLVPLLNTKGNSLTSLELVNLSKSHPFDINLPTVIELCPNLTSLKLWRNSYTTSSRRLEERMGTFQQKRIKLNNSKFKLLKNLTLCGEVPSSNWKCLLSSPTLTEIVIRNCDALTDNVLQEAVKANKFNLLQKLEFFGCNSVTGKGIEVFMTERNPLTEIKLKKCKKLKKSDVENSRNKAIEKNWQLTVQFVPFDPDEFENGEDEEGEDEEGEQHDQQQ